MLVCHMTVSNGTPYVEVRGGYLLLPLWSIIIIQGLAALGGTSSDSAALCTQPYSD